MKNVQKLGGIAALIEAVTYLVGFALLFTMLAPLAGDLAPAAYVDFMLANESVLYLWNLIIYVINGLFLVLLVLALHARLQGAAPLLTQTATAFGLIWAGLVIASGMLILNNMGVVAALAATDPTQAATSWITLRAVEDGLGGGVELPGGVWVMLVSFAALQRRALPGALNYLGITVGVAGILTLVPNLDLFESIFGLGLLVWFVWVGVVMLRGEPRVAPAHVTAAQPQSR